MSPSVTLSTVAGELTPPEFTAEERTTCVIGRASDCVPRIPDERGYRTVSRHHCLLDINPPDIRIRDFGSRNGTYVNGKKIGQREPGQTPQDASGLLYPECDLSDGDEIQLGPAVIRVAIRASEVRDTVGARSLEDPESVARGLLSSAGPQDLLAGYVLSRELGRGSMGAVYLARHGATGEQIALKLMLPRLAATSNARARFMREIALARSLHHPNIVNSYGARTAEGAFCFASEYCPAGSLTGLLDRSGGRLPVADAVRFTIQVLNGLAHAHGNGVVHRDLSPDNILLCAGSGGDLVAKVADFGLAKEFDLAGLSGLTQTGATAGTPAYLPRQQVINFRAADPAVDVWASAACLYRMLAGTCPRDFPATRDPWQVVLRDCAVPVRQREPRIQEELAVVIDHALVDNPEISIKKATELRDLLQRLPLAPPTRVR
jgi:eukaryotic-like serine/threonine-protein kinase